MKFIVKIVPAGPQVFHRAGVQFTHEPAVYELDKEQLGKVENDPMLIVKPYKEKKEEPKPEPEVKPET